MTKHIADHVRDRGESRTRNYTRQERESGTHPTVASLRIRPRQRDSAVNRRATEFARIERGHQV